jgi:prolyl oligopeptidase
MTARAKGKPQPTTTIGRKTLGVSKFDWAKVSMFAYEAHMRADYKVSIKTWLKWMKEIEKFGAKDEKVCYTYWLLGQSYCILGKFTEAEKYFRKASIINRFRKDIKVLNNLWWLAFCHERQKKYKTAVRVYQQIVDLAIKLGQLNSGWPCHASAKAAACLWLVHDFEAAFEAFDAALTFGKNKDTSGNSLSWTAEKLIEFSKFDPKEYPVGQRLHKLASRATKLVSRKLETLSTPVTENRPHRDTYFGHSIDDPFRWLENTHSDEVKKWMESQVKNSNEFFNSIPGRNELTARCHKMFEGRDLRVTYKSGGYYFTATRPLTRLYRSKYAGRFAKLVLNVDELPPEASIQGTSISRNGKYVAYWVMTKGSDWHSLHVKNMSTGKAVPGVLKNLRSNSIVWKADHSGFYYAGFFGKDSHYSEIRFHKLGTAQSRDVLIFKHEQPDAYLHISKTSDEHLLVTTRGRKRDRYGLFLLNTSSKKPTPVRILSEQSSFYNLIGQEKGKLFFLTDSKAPMHRIVSLSIDDILKKNKKTFRPRFCEEVAQTSYSIKRAFYWQDYLVCIYVTKKGEVLERFNLKDGKRRLSPVKLPDGTSVHAVNYMDFPLIRMVVEGYSVPTTICELNFATGQFSPKMPIQSVFDLNQLVSEKLYARSRDGRQIPYSVLYKKGMKWDGRNPTILTGYGGFARSVDATFNNYNLLWVNLGGVYVEAVLRGDSGLGAKWRADGMRENKQNTFDDFIAVAEDLIRRKITQPSRLGIRGFSNGGLLVGAVMVQRPELFAAVEIGAGLLDMLRFHNFGTEKHYASEYGSATNKKFFDVLRAYSPLHNLKRRDYPATFICTGSHDDRVNPAHSYKFTAALQKHQTGKAPVILCIEKDEGHNFVKKSMWGVNRLAFFGHTLGLLPNCLWQFAPKSTPKPAPKSAPK